MALVPAKCTQCGGQIEVDDSKEAGVCKHCGMPFITEKAINNYTTVHNVTNHVTKIINGKEVEDGEDFYNRAMSHLKLEEYDDAKESIAKAVKKNPDNAEFRFAEILIETKNLTEFSTIFDTKKIENLLKVADKKSKTKWIKETGFDFSGTKADLCISIIKKAIDSNDFNLIDISSKYFDKLTKADCEKFFQTQEMAEYFSALMKSLMAYKDEDALAWFEKLFGLVVYYGIFTDEYRYAIVRAYLSIVKTPHTHWNEQDMIQKGYLLTITEDNYKLFMYNQENLSVPYQDIDFVKIIIDKKDFILTFDVTPNIYNYKECKKYDDNGPVGLVGIQDYNPHEVEIMKQLYDVKKLKYNNKEILGRLKIEKRQATKSGRFIEGLKGFGDNLLTGFWLGLCVAGGLCIALPLIFMMFDVVESNNLWSLVFKWAPIGGVVSMIAKTAYLTLDDYLRKNKTKKTKK